MTTPSTPSMAVGPMPGSDRGTAGGGVGRGHVGIGAVIHVEQRALRALQQHPPSLPHRPVHQQPGVRGERQQSRREPLQQRDCSSRSARSVLPISSRQPVGSLDPVGQQLRAHSTRRRSVTRMPRRPYLSSYAGPMPRPVVPSFWLFSLAASSSL